MSMTDVMVPTRARSGGQRYQHSTRRRRPAARPAAPSNQQTATPIDDSALVPVTGILDVQENYAFVRTSGYLAGPDDVYVSMAQIKKYDLRPGDAVTGAARPGERALPPHQARAARS